MTLENEPRLSAFLDSLKTMPWFAEAGHPSEKYHVVADAVVAWDDWNAPMLAVWNPRSQRLEDAARRALGDKAIDEIFESVSAATEQAVVNGVRAYFARRPDETENTAIDVDRGLWPEIVGFVLRDMSWAAVETVLGQPDFFVSLLRVYQEGRWPCSWKGRYPDGRFVVL
jgi:hypothetical protein